MIDAFDPANLKLSPEHEEAAKAAPRPTPKRAGGFIMVPLAWLERLAEVQSATTFRVALALLYQSWRQGKGRPVSLSNAALEAQGVSRYAKTRALQKLETLGLITVERCKGQTPSVTIIHR